MNIHPLDSSAPWLVIPAHCVLIPARRLVIPAKAGIQDRENLDPRFRGDDAFSFGDDICSLLQKHDKVSVHQPKVRGLNPCYSS